MNKNIEQISKLSKYEDQFLQGHGLPQALFAVGGQQQLPDEIWHRVEDYQKKGGFDFL